MYDDDILKRGLDALGLELTADRLDRLHTYYEMMVETNKVMNLTAITDYSEVCVKHWLDSLSLSKVLPELNLGETVSLIDVGTGAGFPGIPLKIFHEDWKITLLDSLGKRVRFLEQVTEACGLTDVTCVHGRAEEFSRKPEYREQYDLCVSRAVTRMASLAELCIPFVKVGGYFVPYKAGDSETEIKEGTKAIRAMGGEIVNTESFVLPESDHNRVLVVVKKKVTTLPKYPRGGGKPMKAPIV